MVYPDPGFPTYAAMAEAAAEWEDRFLCDETARVLT